MLQDYVNANVLKIIKQKNLLLIFAVGMLLLNLLLGVGLLLRQEKIVLVPPEITRPLWVQGSTASTQYLEEMSVFLSNLLLDQTPTSAKLKRNVVLRYVTSSAYNGLLRRLVKQEEYLAEHDISTRFFLKETKPDGNQVQISGELVTYVADKQVSQELVTYLIEFEYNGQFLMSKFERVQ